MTRLIASMYGLSLHPRSPTASLQVVLLLQQEEDRLSTLGLLQRAIQEGLLQRKADRR
jgi:hypothetical protein